MKNPSPRQTENMLRTAVVSQCRWMNASGLNQGTSGNISVRHEGRMLITPTSISYDRMTPAMLASFQIEGEYGRWEGTHTPSTEWRFHLDIMRTRPEVGAIVHTHSTFATILSIARKPIPACHYMVAAFGGNNVRVADYATYGTKELADNALVALEGRTGCLLANHGMIATGKTVEEAMWRAVELETIAKQYFHALQIEGGPVILPDSAIEETLRAFGGYGLQDLKKLQAQPRRRSAAATPKRAASAPRKRARG